MRRPTKALTAATLVVALSATMIRGQQSPRGTPSATDAPSSSTPGTSSALSGRTARALLRNGQDYLGYQEYNRALKYLREAESRKDELNAAEQQDLKAALEKGMTGLRGPVNGSAQRYAKGPSKRPGAIALAKPPGEDKQVQLASTVVPPPKMEDGTKLPYLPKQEKLLPAAAPVAAVAGAPLVEEPQALALASDQAIPAPVVAESPQSSVPLPVTSAELEPPLPLPAPDLVQAPPSEMVVPIADQNSPTPLPPEDPPVQRAATAVEMETPLPSEEADQLPPLPGSLPSVEATRPAAPAMEMVPEPTPVPSDAPEPLPPLPDQPPAPPVDALMSDLASDPGTNPPSGDPPLPPEADLLPPLPDTNLSQPTPLPVTPVVENYPTRARANPRALTNSADGPGFFRRPDIKVESTLTPELKREVERIANAQDEAARRNPAPPALISDSTDPNRRSRELVIPRAPSPTEARPIKAIPVPEDFEPLQARQWTPQRKYWSAAATCHGPLYFQDASLERYGHSVETFFGGAGRFMTYPIDDPKQSKQRIQILQPIFSAGLFAGQIAALPYNLIVDPIWEPEYDLGYYRPGDKLPKDVYYLPWRGIGGIFGRQ